MLVIDSSLLPCNKVADCNREINDRTREHWIQRITFAAETNAADTHSVIA